MVEMANKYFSHRVLNYDELGSTYFEQTVTYRNTKMQYQLLVLICFIFVFLWPNAGFDN